MILATLLMLGAVSVPPTKPIHAKPTYAEIFDKQVDSLNDAMMAYGLANCKEPTNFNKVATKFQQELLAFGDLIKEQPDSEPVSLKWRQLEIGFGIERVSTAVINDRNACVTKNFDTPDFQYDTGQPHIKYGGKI